MKIENEKKAWRKYNLTILTEEYMEPLFIHIDDINIKQNEFTKISLNFSIDLSATAIDCSTMQVINWIQVENKKHLVFNATKLNTTKQWVKLISRDSWGKEFYSDMFDVIIKSDTYPLTITGILGTLTIYVGTKNIFLIPSDLYYSKSDSFPISMSASTLNWTVNISYFYFIKHIFE